MSAGLKHSKEHTTLAGMIPENKKKNRYKDIMPCEYFSFLCFVLQAFCQYLKFTTSICAFMVKLVLVALHFRPYFLLNHTQTHLFQIYVIP